MLLSEVGIGAHISLKRQYLPTQTELHHDPLRVMHRHMPGFAAIEALTVSVTVCTSNVALCNSADGVISTELHGSTLYKTATATATGLVCRTSCCLGRFLNQDSQLFLMCNVWILT
jgi:glutamate mutase epsilon subunit